MATRRCLACNGTGSLWGTPKLIEEGGLQDRPKAPQSDTPSNAYGTDVKCWRCAGLGYVPADRDDIGQHNG